MRTAAREFGRLFPPAPCRQIFRPTIPLTSTTTVPTAPGRVPPEWATTVTSVNTGAEALPAAQSLTLSSDPAFLGDPTLLNPEQLLLLAAASCQLLSFLAVAARARLDILSYEDEAEADMPEDDRPVRLTFIRLRPRIMLKPGNADESRVRQLVQLAHHECYIANSLKTEITVEPTIVWSDR